MCDAGGSAFLHKVDEIMTTELKHMPGRYSLTALLVLWVRACRRSYSCSGTITTESGTNTCA